MRKLNYIKFLPEVTVYYIKNTIKILVRTYYVPDIDKIKL